MKKIIGISRELMVHYLVQYTASLRPFASQYCDFWNITDDTPHFGYLCPLCLINGFWVTSDDTLFSTTEFSLDHYPPESTAGFETIPVCKLCNNRAGTRYEVALTQKLSERSFEAGIPGATLTAKSEISSIPGRYASVISIRPDGAFDVSFKPNPKTHVPHLDKWLETSTQDLNWKADVTIPVADEKKVARALLKAAFLYAFAGWGYEFAFSYTGSKIRRVLFEDDDYPLDLPSFWLGGQTPPGTKLPVGLCYAYNNTVFRCFVINVPLKDKATGYSNLASVLVPGPKEKDWDNLMAAGPGFERYGQVTFSMDHVRENLAGPQMPDAYSKSWALLQHK